MNSPISANLAPYFARLRYLGVTGLNALTKLMGFLLLCVGVQFVVNGIIGIVTDPVLLRGIQELPRSEV